MANIRRLGVYALSKCRGFSPGVSKYPTTKDDDLDDKLNFFTCSNMNHTVTGTSAFKKTPGFGFRKSDPWEAISSSALLVNKKAL